MNGENTISMMMNFVIGKMEAVVVAGSGSKGTCQMFDEWIGATEHAFREAISSNLEYLSDRRGRYDDELLVC